jgi:D-serine deaminase-like pyridoxal phosphate-dependent protein
VSGIETERGGLDLAAIVEQVTDTPRLVVDRRIVEANVRRMAALAAQAGKALRPHTKTHKMLEIARLQVATGASGIQVAKLGEAQVMADAGISDILVGYPIVGAEKLARLAALAERVSVTVSLDSLVVAEGISRAVAGRGARVRIVVEVDTGLRRIGVQPADAVSLAIRCAALPGLDVAGVLTHEGHVYTAADRPSEMERMTHAACRAIVDVAERMREAGVPAIVVSAGASATARFDLAVDGITEVRPGTYVFNDLTQLDLGAATEADVAAAVVATVVSRPAADRAIVDAGSKTLSSDQRIIAAPTRTFGRLAGREDVTVVRISEEHGVLGLRGDDPLTVGDRVVILPNHICAAVNLHDDVLVFDGPTIVDRWRVAARGAIR